MTPMGSNAEKLAYVMELKNLRRGRIREYADRFHGATFTPAKNEESNPLWAIAADCAFPSATQNEISVWTRGTSWPTEFKLVAEGANMPTTPKASTASSRPRSSMARAGCQRRRRGGFRPRDDPGHRAPLLDSRAGGRKLRQIMRAIHTNVRAASRGVRQAGRLRLGSQYRRLRKGG